MISPPAVGLDDIDYELVAALPERTQPRLLPRTGVRDDPSFAEAKEIHLARDPGGGGLIWTGEWQASSLSGPSSGVSVKRLDDLVAESKIVRAGFDESVSVLADSSTGKTEVWRAPKDSGLISTREVIDEARALPLAWSERRCCDSDGHSYTARLREVVEPRLAFKDARPYYVVTVVPTSELAIGREVEYTLLVDARSGEQIDSFAHVEGGSAEDARLERFFR